MSTPMLDLRTAARRIDGLSRLFGGRIVAVQPGAVPTEEGPRRLPYGCLVALLPVALLLYFIAAFMFGDTSLDPPPGELVPPLPEHVTVRCEVTEEGTAGFERKEAAAAEARRILVVTSETASTQALMDDVAAAFERDGWDVEQYDLGGGWHDAALFEDQYFLRIDTFFDADGQGPPCDPGLDPDQVQLVEVTIGDHPWD